MRVNIDFIEYAETLKQNMELVVENHKLKEQIEKMMKVATAFHDSTGFGVDLLFHLKRIVNGKEKM